MAITDPKWPKVYDPNDGRNDPLRDPKWRWDAGAGGGTFQSGGIKEVYYWREQAEYWKIRYQKALKAYENLFPSGETAGRIVMLYWDGQTWIRLPEAASEQGMAEQERLAQEIALKKSIKDQMTEIKVRVLDTATDLLRMEKTFQIGVEVAIEPEPPKPPKIERTRRNNVVE